MPIIPGPRRQRSPSTTQCAQGWFGLLGTLYHKTNKMKPTSILGKKQPADLPFESERLANLIDFTAEEHTESKHLFSSPWLPPSTPPLLSLMAVFWHVSGFSSYSPLSSPCQPAQIYTSRLFQHLPIRVNWSPLTELQDLRQSTFCYFSEFICLLTLLHRLPWWSLHLEYSFP